MSRTAPIALATLLSLTALAAPLPAQDLGDAETSLRRIFASRDFAPESFGPSRWLAEGGSYTTLEPSETARGARDIVRYETATGRRDVYVSASQLVPAGATAPLAINDYVWSPDGGLLLIFTNSQRVWRSNTRGDYWVLDRKSGALKKLGGADARPSTLMFAKFSPQGDRVAYVREGDLYVERLADGAIARLTDNASRTLVNGTTDWVYEEEFSLRDAYRWSPDGTKIAYWQFDMSGVRDFLLINNTDSLYSYTISFQYPKAGTTNSAVRAGVVSAEGGATTWLDLPGEQRENYLPRMEWAGNSSELLLQRMNRQQNTNRVMLADAVTGRARDLFVERDSAWLDVVNDWRWLDGGKRLLWVSERDGWRHLYTISRADGSARLLTPGAYDVISVAGVDEKGGWIYLVASLENYTQRYLYRVPLKGGKAERVTPAAQAGTHGYTISPDGRWAFHTASRFDVPPTTDLVQLPAHRVARTMVENQRLRTAVAPLLTRPTEFFRVPVGAGVELDGWMILPSTFDPAKKYPLIMFVYSEPASTTVNDRWGGNGTLWYRMLADLGYIVASVDNRGTPSPRGRAWRKVVYGSIGELASQEQAEAVRSLIRTRPYIDAERVGIMGSSGGGSATLNALFRYPELYKVGIASAPVADQHLYNTIYQERYMGLPQQNEGGYRRGSPLYHAEGLKGKLLLIHGTGDDNVHYQGTELLANRLIELGKQFDFASYPNRTHSIGEGAGTTLHVNTLRTRYLLDHLPAGGR